MPMLRSVAPSAVSDRAPRRDADRKRRCKDAPQDHSSIVAFS
jgi:hypothetical protein